MKWCRPVAAVVAPLTLACFNAGRTTPEPGVAQSGVTEVVRVPLERQLPPMDGASLHVALVEVTYPAGAGSAPHWHRCPVIGRVISGTLQFQLAGSAVSTYRAGEAFYEAAGRVHLVSRNASTREPVTFVAFFICDGPGPRTVEERP